MIINKVKFADDTAIIAKTGYWKAIIAKTGQWKAKTQEEQQYMVNRLVDMEINIHKSQSMRVGYPGGMHHCRLK